MQKIREYAIAQGKLPVRMIAPGRVFRSDEVDVTHSLSFHQVEGYTALDAELENIIIGQIVKILLGSLLAGIKQKLGLYRPSFYASD